VRPPDEPLRPSSSVRAETFHAVTQTLDCRPGSGVSTFCSVPARFPEAAGDRCSGPAGSPAGLGLAGAGPGRGRLGRGRGLAGGGASCDRTKEAPAASRQGRNSNSPRLQPRVPGPIEISPGKCDTTMPHSLADLLIHVFFSTKDQRPILDDDLRSN